MNTDNSFLHAFGGVESNSLNNKLESNNLENDESDQIQIICHSSYYDKIKFENLIQSKIKMLQHSKLQHSGY